MGQECWRCRGGSTVFYKYFGSRYKAEIFAVGGKSLHPLPITAKQEMKALESILTSVTALTVCPCSVSGQSSWRKTLLLAWKTSVLLDQQSQNRRVRKNNADTSNSVYNVAE